MRNFVLACIVVAFLGCGKHDGTTAPPPASAPMHDLLKKTDAELILDQVLNDVLTNPRLADSREFYGTPSDQQIALVTSSHYGVAWPESYVPAVEGYSVHRVFEGTAAANQPPMLGVRIDKLNLEQKESGIFDAPIEITLLNAGGPRNGAIIAGGCSVRYAPKREEGGWVVEYSGALDP